MKSAVSLKALTAAGTALTLLAVAANAYAYDLSLPFRSYPGFQCFRYNNLGECVDFVYDANGRPSSGTSSSRTSGTSTVDSGDLTLRLLAPTGSQVRAGSTVTYRIRLTNDTGHSTTTNIRAFLDSDMTFSSATQDGRRISREEVEWEDIRVSADDEEELLLRVRISSSARIGDRLTLRVETDDTDRDAVITVDVSHRASVTSSSNCSIVYYYVNGRRVSSRSTRFCDDDDDDEVGDYRISISDAPDPFEPGELLTYTITIRNLDDRSRHVDASAFLDDHVTYVSASNSPDERGNDELFWEDLSIGSNSSRTLTLNVRTDRSLDDGDTVELTVRVNGDEETEESEALFP